jgi:DNA-directed RNA polymerase specialized sigma54-like protein
LADCQEQSRASKHQQRNRKILTEVLEMRKVCAKMVPSGIIEDQKQRRFEICEDLLRKMTFWAVSSQVNKDGSTNMTLK